jgi:hypothetical protein
MYWRLFCLWTLGFGLLLSIVTVAETVVSQGKSESSEAMSSAVNVKFVIHIPETLSLNVREDLNGRLRIESTSNIPGKQVSESIEGWVASVP